MQGPYEQHGPDAIGWNIKFYDDSIDEMVPITKEKVLQLLETEEEYRRVIRALRDAGFIREKVIDLPGVRSVL